MSIQIKKSGGVVSGKAKVVISNAIEEVNEDIGQEAYNRVQQLLGASLKSPTGYYQSQIVTNVQSNTLEISDGGIVYGPWLEGTSSRNETTGFKGYHTFRTVMQEMEKSADKIADKAIGKAVKRLS